LKTQRKQLLSSIPSDVTFPGKRDSQKKKKKFNQLHLLEDLDISWPDVKKLFAAVIYEQSKVFVPFPA
jgi:hypothetical protein